MWRLSCCIEKAIVLHISVNYAAHKQIQTLTKRHPTTTYYTSHITPRRAGKWLRCDRQRSCLRHLCAENPSAVRTNSRLALGPRWCVYRLGVVCTKKGAKPGHWCIQSKRIGCRSVERRQSGVKLRRIKPEFAGFSVQNGFRTRKWNTVGGVLNFYSLSHTNKPILLFHPCGSTDKTPTI